MTGVLDGLVCAALIVGGTLGARWAGWRWHGWHLRRVHAQHAGGPPEMEPLIVGAGDRRFGSMGLDDDVALCEGCREHFHCDGGVLDCDCTCRWPEDWAEREEEFLPAAPDWREQTMAELGALADPGPGVVAPSGPPPGPVPSDWPPEPPRSGDVMVWRDGHAHYERLCGPEQPHEKPAGTESAGSGHPNLGPRAAAVLERYEQRRQERWALA